MDNASFVGNQRLFERLKSPYNKNTVVMHKSPSLTKYIKAFNL